jgi:hypothetical protein
MGTAIVLTMGVLSMGFATAAHAADYPPVTSNEVIQGTTVPPTVVPSSVSDASAGLPFTGGNDGTIFWIGIAAVGTGSFAAWSFRRRRRAA